MAGGAGSPQRWGWPTVGRAGARAAGWPSYVAHGLGAEAHASGERRGRSGSGADAVVLLHGVLVDGVRAVG